MVLYDKLLAMLWWKWDQWGGGGGAECSETSETEKTSVDRSVWESQRHDPGKHRWLLRLGHYPPPTGNAQREQDDSLPSIMSSAAGVLNESSSCEFPHLTILHILPRVGGAQQCRNETVSDANSLVQRCHIMSKKHSINILKSWWSHVLVTHFLSSSRLLELVPWFSKMGLDSWNRTWLHVTVAVLKVEPSWPHIWPARGPASWSEAAPLDKASHVMDGANCSDRSRKSSPWWWRLACLPSNCTRGVISVRGGLWQQIHHLL